MGGALNRLLVEEGLAPLPAAAIRPVVSHGAARLVKLGFPGTDGDEFERLRLRFLELYSRTSRQRDAAVSGLLDLLDELERRSVPWGIVTNKPGWLTDPLLDRAGTLDARRLRRQRRYGRGAQAAPVAAAARRRPDSASHPGRASTSATPNATSRRAAPPACRPWSRLTATSATTIRRRAGSHRHHRSPAAVAEWVDRGPRSDSEPAVDRNSLLLLALVPLIALAAGWLIGRRRAHALEIELATRAGRTQVRRGHRPGARAGARTGACRSCGPGSIRSPARRCAATARSSCNSRGSRSASSRSSRCAVSPSARNRSRRCWRRCARRCRRRTSRSPASRRSAPRPSARCRNSLERVTLGQVALQRETRNLVTALRRPEVRGQWGEMTLKRLAELAGMVEHCDFVEQVHVAGEDGNAAPGHDRQHAGRTAAGRRRQDAARRLSLGGRGHDRRGSRGRDPAPRAGRAGARPPARVRRPTGRSSSTARISWCCSFRATSS